MGIRDGCTSVVAQTETEKIQSDKVLGNGETLEKEVKTQK